MVRKKRKWIGFKMSQLQTGHKQTNQLSRQKKLFFIFKRPKCHIVLKSYFYFSQKPKCHTVYKTIYETIYETSYKEECQTHYDKKCHTGKFPLKLSKTHLFGLTLQVSLAIRGGLGSRNIWMWIVRQCVSQTFSDFWLSRNSGNPEFRRSKIFRYKTPVSESETFPKNTRKFSRK